MGEVNQAGLLDFQSIYDFFDGLLPESLDWMAYGLAGLSLAFIVINALLVATALYTWFERRAIGRFQSRLGPNRWGPFGLFQPIADGIKLLTKEDTVPKDADRPVFNLAPIIFLAPTLLVVSIIPFGEGSFLGRLNIGALFLIGITSVNIIAVFMAGWASRNKYAILGAMRGVAMLISYEVPMALAITGVLLAAGSLSLLDIVRAQDVPFLLVQPLGFFVFMAASLAEISRTPFDQVEAESELGAGFHTEYSGMKFAVLQLAEFMAPIVTALIATTLFLGGTRGFDPVPGQIWFVLKAFAVVFTMLWFRATWPRLRIDQITAFAWKALFLLAFVNLFLVAVEVEWLRDSETGTLSTDALWAMAGVNWGVTVASLVAMATIMDRRRLRPAAGVDSSLAGVGGEAD